jgi:hypothetical protein
LSQQPFNNFFKINFVNQKILFTFTKKTQIMLVTKTSQLSGLTHTIDVDVTQEQLDRIEARRENGELIQNIVPHLPKELREFVMTGITPEEWNEMFAENEI